MTTTDIAPARDWGDGAERRQITVLFCDLVGSTALASALDPEDLHELMVAYQRYCERCVEDAGGLVSHYAGDGVMAFFGYPHAMEDAPQRALHAALRLRAAGEHLPCPGGQPLAVRAGVATGLVVVGNLIGKGPAEERAVVGETPNLAARLQASAEPNSIVVAETTMRLAEGVFEFRPLGLLDLKGIPGPTPAWEVVGLSPIVRRFEGRSGAGVTPLVSRAIELNSILQAWQETRLDRRRVVGLVGDPGLGKSRLMEEARLWIAQDAPTGWLEGGGASIHSHTPFHVVSQFAAGALDVAPAGYDDLLSDLRDWVWAEARRRPTVLAVEDLHWVDPSTLDVLDLLIKGEEEGPLLILYTSRIDFTARWPVDQRHQIVSLAALDADSSGALARSVLQDRSDGARAEAIVSQVVAQANGVPLYIEELARLMASKSAAAAHSDIPSTLADLLAARLEALGTAKRNAQLAAVLGHEFSAPLFAAVSRPDGVDSAAALKELVDAGVIVRRDGEGGDLFAFRHALIADAAYDALLRRQRKALHERAATAIIDDFPALAEAQPQILARHWAEAGQAVKATESWEKAAAAANARRAYREAEHAFRQALTNLQRAAAWPERDRAELQIRLSFNRVLQITQGYSSFEAARSSERASELALRIGDTEALSREERARWRSVFTAGDYAEAEKIVSRVMALTAAQGDALWRRTFELRAGIQHGFYTGDLARAERDFLAWHAIQDGRHNGLGDDVLSMIVAAGVARITCRQAVAEERIGGAYAIAERRGNPYDLAMALHGHSSLLHHTHDHAGLAISARRLAEIAKESGFEYAGALADGWLGVAYGNAGSWAEALSHSRAALTAFEKLGARVSLTLWLRLHARCHQMNGDPETALRLFAEAIAFNPQEKVFWPDVYLDRADLLATLDRPAEAERDLRSGVRLAVAMGAHACHLRVLVRLARLQRAQRQEAKLGRTLRSIRPLSHFDHGPFDRAALQSLAEDTGADLGFVPG